MDRIMRLNRREEALLQQATERFVAAEHRGDVILSLANAIGEGSPHDGDWIGFATFASASSDARKWRNRVLAAVEE